MVNKPPANAGDIRDMGSHSSFLAWRIPWTEEPGRLQTTGLQRVGHDWSDLTHIVSVRI